MGDSRKYPYHTTRGILEFRGREGGGGSWTGIPKAWGGGGGLRRLGFQRHVGVSALNSVNFQGEDGESLAWNCWLVNSPSL